MFKWLAAQFGQAMNQFLGYNLRVWEVLISIVVKCIAVFMVFIAMFE